MWLKPNLHLRYQISRLCHKKGFPLADKPIQKNLIHQEENSVILRAAPHTCQWAEAERSEVKVQTGPLSQQKQSELQPVWIFSSGEPKMFGTNRIVKPLSCLAQLVLVRDGQVHCCVVLLSAIHILELS